MINRKQREVSDNIAWQVLPPRTSRVTPNFPFHSPAFYTTFKPLFRPFRAGAKGLFVHIQASLYLLRQNFVSRNHLLIIVSTPDFSTAHPTKASSQVSVSQRKGGLSGLEGSGLPGVVLGDHSHCVWPHKGASLGRGIATELRLSQALNVAEF